MTFTITSPIDARLHAHAKGHWRAKAAATKSARQSAALLAVQLKARPIRGRVEVDYKFIVPDRRRRDLANLVQAAKPLIDGVVDSGLIVGDHWEVMQIGSVSVSVQPSQGVWVELVFRGI